MWRRYVIIIGTACIVSGLILGSVLDLDAHGQRFMPQAGSSLAPRFLAHHQVEKLATRAEAWLTPFLGNASRRSEESAASLPAGQP
ncbi:MAG: hypothetical protein KGO02_21605 [Alphaproteobacteria bacterium]|nr:hypothetical protein [Alphaproteobacteria bacterium]